MLAFLTDEDFHGGVVRGLRLHRPDLDIVRVQEVGLMHQPDALVLEWAARVGRVVLTHDVNTMTREAYARTRLSLPMPGLVVVHKDIPLRQIIDEVLLIAELTLDGETEGQVRYLPL